MLLEHGLYLLFLLIFSFLPEGVEAEMIMEAAAARVV
jgi:hypothetical protein